MFISPSMGAEIFPPTDGENEMERTKKGRGRGGAKKNVRAKRRGRIPRASQNLGRKIPTVVGRGGREQEPKLSGWRKNPEEGAMISYLGRLYRRGRTLRW